MDYVFRISMKTPFSEAVEKTTAALQQEKFGIVSDIDVQAIMMNKLGVSTPAYRILGACAPPLAKQAIEADADSGALLPCNVVVRQSGEEAVIAFLDPKAMLSLAESDALKPLAEEVYARLQRVKDKLLAEG